VHVVRLTGGIGSGKSSLADALRELGVPVVDADQVARRCVAVGTPGLEAVIARFGDGVLAVDGSLDRAALAEIVFADASARRDLEAIIHPCIRAGIDATLTELRDRPVPPEVAVVEHPLLVETGGYARVDTVLVVEAPIEMRIARLVAARGMAESDARNRISAQADDAERRAVADIVVINDGDIEALRAQAQSILARVGSAGTP
jgi:dephospho-CoA kinase